MDPINEKEVSIIKKYPVETVLVLMISAIGFLFYAYFDINADFRKYMSADRAEVTRALENNTRVLDDFLKYNERSQNNK